MSEQPETPATAGTDTPAELGAPTDVQVDPSDVPAEPERTATSDAAAYEEGDSQGGTGGLDAGGAG